MRSYFYLKFWQIAYSSLLSKGNHSHNQSLVLCKFLKPDHVEKIFWGPLPSPFALCSDTFLKIFPFLGSVLCSFPHFLHLIRACFCHGFLPVPANTCCLSSAGMSEVWASISLSLLPFKVQGIGLALVDGTTTTAWFTSCWFVAKEVWASCRLFIPVAWGGIVASRLFLSCKVLCFCWRRLALCTWRLVSHCHIVQPCHSNDPHNQTDGSVVGLISISNSQLKIPNVLFEVFSFIAILHSATWTPPTKP